MSATATSNYIGEAMRATSALAPPSLAGSPGLLAWNLFVMTAAMCLGPMMAGKQARRIWATRAFDHPTDPVSIYRIIIFLAGCAAASRGGAEAISLWSWSSADAHTIERVAELKRWLDPMSVGCGFCSQFLPYISAAVILSTAAATRRQSSTTTPLPSASLS